MFGKMTIGKKLFFSIGAALAAVLVMGVLMFVSLSRVSAGGDRIANEDAKKQDFANQIYINLSPVIAFSSGMQLQAILKDQAYVNKLHQSVRAG
jgi:hypothetical protein